MRIRTVYEMAIVGCVHAGALVLGLLFAVLTLAGVSRERMCGWFKDE